MLTVHNLKDEEQEDNVEIAIDEQGRLVPRSQIEDYTYRGAQLEQYSILSFLVDTWESTVDEKKRVPEPNEDERATAGRPRNQRSRYLPEHSRHATRQRIVRTEGHNTLPNFVGRWFPKKSNDDRDNDFYFASMLALLKPWRDVRDLKPAGSTWKQEFDEFTEHAPKQVRDIISNIQFYHRCSEAAEDHVEEDDSGDSDNEGNDRAQQREMQSEESDGEVEDGAEGLTLTEATLAEAIQNQGHVGEEVYGQVAVEIGRMSHLFERDTKPWNVGARSIGRAEGEIRLQLEGWQASMKRDLELLHQPDRVDDLGPGINDADVVQAQAMDVDDGDGDVVMEAFNELDAAEEAVNKDALKEDQRRAYEIVEDHLRKTLRGEEVDQLLLQVQGEPGTGKSKVINTITSLFRLKRHSVALARSAYTGIAASVVEGRTLHSLLMLGFGGEDPTRKNSQKLAAFWRDIEYLIIDEVSMISREFFAKISRIIQSAKSLAGSPNAHLPFGGVNVLIVGDFHQFPPVVQRADSALYHCNQVGRGTAGDIVGRELYEQFKDVVILQEQVRVTDPVWIDFLQHARYGTCTREHLQMLRKLILTSKDCPPTDFSQAPWKDAILVTPRHSVRTQWNMAATRKHCAETGSTLFICPAEDRIGTRTNEELSLAQRWGIAMKKGSRSATRKEKNGLPDQVELAIGMKVMVTYNVETELDVANGARGTIVDIILDEDEPDYDHSRHEVKLRRVPAFVLVKLDRTKAGKLEGLDEGVLPLEPMERHYEITLPDRKKTRKTVHRRQLTLTAAYAFTDIRSQGQTLKNVIVDIGRVPTGRLTPFNAYVALSRSAGRETIRLLRDFEDSLFTTIPSQSLADEDDRLKRLDEDTKRRWTEREQM